MSMAETQKLASISIGEVLCGRNLSDVLNQITIQHPTLSGADKGALLDLSHGTLRQLNYLRAVLQQMVNQRPAADIEYLLLVALYQLQFTRNAAHAVVYEAVNYAGQLHQGRYQKLVNALLRRFQRERDKLTQTISKQDEVRYNLPLWWINYLKQHYPQYWHNILKAFNQHPPMTLRINRRHTDAAQYLEQLQAAGLTGQILDTYSVMLTKPVPVNVLPGFDSGWVSIQDYGAQKAIPLLNPQDGERILDACAAPGGKTGHILEWADCHVTALDIDERRLTRVKENLDRLNLSAQLCCADAQVLDSWYDNKPFDAVLADVPCTASGILKRHPDIRWLRQPQDGRNTARQQEALLDSLWQVLKPGGRMLLATCSIFTEENQQQLTHFLNRHADARSRQSHVLLPNNKQDGFFYAIIDKI
ncbi:16S rRNA (cytosine(967)-C(5))-methyltransferase RsmB [Neisseriaceae bacterium ESL0693]|nr:16S rRNA (cytosine(967)-C(5))-methyltransferase RsmB [Neisseriaceae bacterium ESL0693]